MKFQDELDLIQDQDVRISNYLSCYSDHFLGVEIENKYYLTSFVDFGIIYPDLTSEDIDILTFDYTKTSDLEDKAITRKNAALADLTCEICNYDMKDGIVYKKDEFKKHLRNH